MHKVKYIHNMCQVQNNKYYLHNNTKKEYIYDPPNNERGDTKCGAAS